jgi:hypothetical protein
MMLKISNFFAKVFMRFSKADNKETWHLLEMQHRSNLENLEDLKKLRIKYF